jgi:hypothetical protein
MVILAMLLWWKQNYVLKYLPKQFVTIAGTMLYLGLWLLGNDRLITLTMMVGSIVLLIKTRKQLTGVAWLYGVFGILLLIMTGRTTSIIRLIYGIVTLAPALALSVEKFPRLRYAITAFSILFFITLGLRFGQGYWVA